MKTLIKILFPVVLGCLLQHLSYAQTNPARVNASDSKILYGVINPLNETQTWTTVWPDKLQYWSKEMRKAGWMMLSDYPQNMKAKRAKNGETPDFTFTLNPQAKNFEDG